MKDVIAILEERGFIDALTNKEIREITKQPIRVYCGFDPTSDSLHLGNLVSIMGLAWFQQCGHTPVAIVGGATGMIGDPSGRSSERNLLDEKSIHENLEGISLDLKAVLDFQCDNKPLILNNLDWFKNFSLIDFLRSIGKHFRIGTMLAKDSVKGRLETEEGMSYTEFSYQLLQSYDFLHLYQEHGVTVQLGGSDQWGNITAGIDLVRKMTGKQVYGVTFPLLTKSDGKKFGKSEKGAIWLSPKKLSPYEFYQYLVRTTDEDVIKLMRMLTFMDMSEIRQYEKMLQEQSAPPNTAQRKLAEEVTRIVHGEPGLEVALKATAAASPGSGTVLDVSSLELISGDMPSAELEKKDVIGVSLPDLIVALGLLPGKGAVRRLIEGGGVYLNNKQITDPRFTMDESCLIESKLFLLALGKKNKIVVRIK